MVMIGKNRHRAELRRKPRQAFHYAARIVVDRATPPQKCAVADVSQTGARIVLDADKELPDNFMLVLSLNGRTRRRCQVVWRDGTTLGVKFLN